MQMGCLIWLFKHTIDCGVLKLVVHSNSNSYSCFTTIKSTYSLANDYEC